MAENSLDLELLRISLQEVLLHLLEEDDLYGKQMVDVICRASNGAWNIETSTIYPSLKKMEDKGLIESYWGDESCDHRRGNRRRYYTITSLGKIQLSAVGNFRASLRPAIAQVG